MILLTNFSIAALKMSSAECEVGIGDLWSMLTFSPSLGQYAL